MQWPHTAHILDYLRCSVVFDNIQDFLNGFNHFYNEFNSNTTNLREKMYHQKRCIKCIVRIKNDFDGIEDNCKNLDLRPFNYCDIKCNVLIEYQGIRIIGEIQFLLAFMGHSIYSFQRKSELFEKLSQLMMASETTNGDNILVMLRKYILSYNMTKFSTFFENMTVKEKYYILKKKSQIINLLKQSKWNKGLALFLSVVDQQQK